MDWKQTKDELIRAILDRDVEQIGRIADRMRFQGKLNYDQSFEVANQLTGVSEGEWDELLFEADNVID